MRISKAIRLIRRHLQGTVALALVPLALVFCRPTAGCICADGHYEPFCQGQYCASGEHQDEQSDGPHRGVGCSCCGQHAAMPKETSAAHKNCCPASDKSCPDGDQASGSKKCCTPVAQTPVVKTSTLAWQGDESIFVYQVAEASPLPFLQPVPVDQRREIDVGPPPDDLVVILRRLLI